MESPTPICLFTIQLLWSYDDDFTLERAHCKRFSVENCPFFAKNRPLGVLNKGFTTSGVTGHRTCSYLSVCDLHFKFEEDRTKTAFARAIITRTHRRTLQLILYSVNAMNCIGQTIKSTRGVNFAPMHIRPAFGPPNKFCTWVTFTEAINYAKFHLQRLGDI